jgi:hypothetical protein
MASAGRKAVISAVADGDTVDAAFGNPPEGCGQKERVRLIGVNTPELTKDPPEYYAEEARELNDRIAALICSEYHVSREFLLTGKGEMFDASAPDVRLGQLLEVFEQLDPLFKEFILLQIWQLLTVQKKSKEKGAE